jgi:hypothetical protein
MPPRELSHGARRCLDRLRWYQQRYGRVHPFQQKFAERLGVSDRQLRNYLAELRAAGLVSTQKGGPGHPASYRLTPSNTSGLISGQLPVYFRSKPTMEDSEVRPDQRVKEENLRSKAAQFSSSGSYPSDFDQSESTVQEHLEQAIPAIEPSPYEKAQADAIANSVQACVFEPTPDLIAKLERKRRHYGVTGFVVASAIARAFKLVEGTSDTPQKPAWFTAVVENALKPSERDKTERHSVAGETPAAYRPKWTPRPIPAADADQADGAAVATTRATEEKRRQFQSMTSNMSPPTAPACLRCGSDGVVDGTVSWCDCERGREQRRARPGYVDYLVRKGWKPGAIAAAVQPRPPQSEPAPLRDVATAAGGAR